MHTTGFKSILFGHHGRYGDICIGVPSIYYLNELFPNCKIYININKDYQDIAPLFYNNKNIHGIFISDDYENFPSDLDRTNWLNCKFECVYDPMAKRKDEPDWFMKRHQTIDCAYQYGLQSKNDKITLNKWFNSPIFDKTIAFHATPANYDKNNTKSFTKQKSQELVNLINKLGYTVLQVGAKNDEKLENTIKFDTDFFNSVKNILGCKMFLGGDSGLTWALSGYDFPVLACYSDYYYIRNGINYIHNIQAKNNNAIYLSDNNVNDIPNYLIIDNIKQLI